ncbi:TetR/AcrR family transcriptional regulator [Mucilaginibacter celer]|uniref:TetR family transcriptional regulator n=1 Tax=Mucilaginibacter celer TaxID=2305508 RepID=A0A494VSH5_9SPHI|nr:TetR/AcrR family transcriptional regulator [Mucilaginibacter celer]AYL94303.1 TetR family transcriptional regulator [Mucilaginibacter celer]
MSITERKIKEKEEMRKLILNGARKVFLENGYESASIRNIAEEISYSPSSIYFYFREKGEIFHELHEEGFRLLLNNMKVLEHVNDPFERLKAMGGVYIDFAIHNKDFYNLMFIVDAPLKKKEEDEPWRMGVKTLDFLIHVVRECIAAGKFQGLNAENLSFTILSALHGMCALFCKDRTSTFTDRTSEQLIRDGYQTFMAMMDRL